MLPLLPLLPMLSLLPLLSYYPIHLQADLALIADSNEAQNQRPYSQV